MSDDRTFDESCAEFVASVAALSPDQFVELVRREAFDNLGRLEPMSVYLHNCNTADIVLWMLSFVFSVEKLVTSAPARSVIKAQLRKACEVLESMDRGGN